MSANGYNPMRWDCERQGCFNKRCRPKLEQFADIWPGRISMSDIDGIVEISGRFLLLEWKADPRPIPTGQRIMFERLTALPGYLVCVFVVAGDAETMVVTALNMVVGGTCRGWHPTDTAGLRQRMADWCAWAQTSPATP